MINCRSHEFYILTYIFSYQISNVDYCIVNLRSRCKTSRGYLGKINISLFRKIMWKKIKWKKIKLQVSNRGYLMGRVGRVDGWDGISKVSFNFLHTLWLYRLCIYLLVYEIKIVTNILMGFKVSCQVGGRGQKFQNYSR